MSKVKFNKLPLVYPIPSVLIGTVINDKPNFATIGNCGIISVNPAVIYISMENILLEIQYTSILWHKNVVHK